VQQGEIKSRLRRLTTFIVSAAALVVALALMAVADGGGGKPAPRHLAGRIAQGVVRPSIGADETPVARPGPSLPPKAVQPAAPAAPPVTTPPVTAPPASTPVVRTPATPHVAVIVRVELPPPAPTKLAPPTTIPRNVPTATTTPKNDKKEPKPRPSVFPPKGILGGGRDDDLDHHGKRDDQREDQCDDERQSAGRAGKLIVNRARRAAAVRLVQDRKAVRPSRSGARHPHRGTRPSCRPRSD
jgi:hypothetical protein